MNIKDMLLTLGSTHGRPGTLLTPKGITIHYVGNPGSTAAANRNWFENGAAGAYSSAHYIVGLIGEILRLIPENERAGHAGKSYGPQWNEMAKTNNSRYIGIECCHPDANGKFSDATYAALVELCADICKRYGFDPRKDIVRHYDITGKACPVYYKNNAAAWTQLLNDVVSALGGATVKFNLLGKQIVNIDGEIKNGTTYIKARPLLEALGYVVDWDGETQMALVNLPKRE